MCGSLHGNAERLNGKGKAEINPKQGVDGSQNRATMGGSLGKKFEGLGTRR